jgi:zinc transporter ZupT
MNRSDELRKVKKDLSELLNAIMAVAVVSLLSLIGIFTISLRKTTLDRILFFLLSFSAGSILGVAFLDLLPEAIELFGICVLVSWPFSWI